MIRSLRQRWRAQTPRQRTYLTAALVLGASALYLWLLLSAEQARNRLQQRVGMIQGQASQVDQHAEEFERLRAVPIAAMPASDLYALVNARLTASPGLMTIDTRVEALGRDRVTIELRSVSFAQWLNWVEGMAAQRVLLESCRIEALAMPGMVSVTAQLTRNASP